MMKRNYTSYLKSWATPVTAGAFVLLAVTGILMFFHWDSGLNKIAHEWLGWALVVGVLAHTTMHSSSLVKHLRRPVGAAIVGVFVLLLALSFISVGGEEQGGSARVIMQRLESVPLENLAPVAGVSSAELVAKLQAQGYEKAAPRRTVQEISGGDRHTQTQVLGIIFR